VKPVRAMTRRPRSAAICVAAAAHREAGDVLVNVAERAQDNPLLAALEAPGGGGWVFVVAVCRDRGRDRAAGGGRAQRNSQNSLEEPG
jgi:hypothetical protein